MGKLLVTGATGHLGRLTLQLLLELVPAERLAGLARDPSRAADLAEQGVDIRQGDYFDYESLLRAFDGVEKLCLIATHAFTDRNTQHFNAIAGTVTLVEKWSGTVGFGAAAMKQRSVVHLSGNDGRGDFPPDREAVSHLGTPFGCGQSVSARPKMR